MNRILFLSRGETHRTPAVGLVGRQRAMPWGQCPEGKNTNSASRFLRNASARRRFLAEVGFARVQLPIECVFVAAGRCARSAADHPASSQLASRCARARAKEREGANNNKALTQPQSGHGSTHSNPPKWARERERRLMRAFLLVCITCACASSLLFLLLASFGLLRRAPRGGADEDPDPKKSEEEQKRFASWALISQEPD